MEKTTLFWNWFKENNKSYLFINSLDEDLKEKHLDKCLEQLHLYCDKLYFEIGGLPNEVQELIVTAEGDKDYFDEVERLISAAPEINGWTFIAFKPATVEHFTSKWSDLKMTTEEMWFQPLSNEGNSNLGIRVFIPDQAQKVNHKSFKPLLFKMLDTIIGERSFALDIQYVDTSLLQSKPEEQGLLPILELPEYIKWHKSQRMKSRS
jgi:hypothetical protein